MSTPAPSPPDRKYAVFISYRHADNKEQGRQWATWLHHTLETYEVPPDLVGRTNLRGEPVPDSLYPVFRDEEELPADADLSANIQRALRHSALLVVLCSPRAVESRFVADEIRFFKELGKAGHILALMIDGEPNASDDPGKARAGIRPEHECLPEPLRYGVPRADGSIDWTQRTEPIAADVRPENQPVQGWTTAAAYREELTRQGLAKREIERLSVAYEEQLQLATMKIIAGAIGLPLGEVTQRDKAMQLARTNQRAKMLRRWLIAVGALTMLVIFGGLAAWHQKQKADLNAILAHENEVAAKKQEQAVRSQLAEAARTDWINGKRLLDEGRQCDAFAYFARSCKYDSNSLLALETSTYALNNWTFPVSLATLDGDVAQFNPDGSVVVTIVDDNTMALWDAISGDRERPPSIAFEGQGTSVNDAHFSPDGSWIVTTSAKDNDLTARVWEAKNGELVATLQGHEGHVLGAHFCADGSRIVTTALDTTARIWEVPSGRLLTTLPGHSLNYFTDAQFSPDGSCIVTSDGGETAWIWATQTGSLVATLKGHTDQIWNANFSPDGSRILTASHDKTARIWDAKSGNLLATLQHDGDVVRAQFSPDGTIVATASRDKTARIWNALNGKLHFILQGHDGDVVSAQFCPDGRFIVTASQDKTARVWDTKTGNLLAILQGHEGNLLGAEFSPDGSRIITRFLNASYQNEARLWEMPTPKLPNLLRGHQQIVEDARFSPNGSRIVTASMDTTARVWDARSGKMLSIFPGNKDDYHVGDSFLIRAQFSPDGSRVVAVNDMVQRIWDTQNNRLLATLADQHPGKSRMELQGKQHPADHATCSRDGGRILAVSEDKNAEVWDVPSGKLLSTLQGYEDDAEEEAQFSSDGWHILKVLERKGVRIWDVKSGKLTITIQENKGRVKSAMFSPDGMRILTISEKNEARVWDIRNGTQMSTLLGYEGRAEGSAHFSPDGMRILIGSRVWDIQSGKQIMTLQCRGTSVWSAQFSSDGRQIVTGPGNLLGADTDETARVWEAQSGKLLATLRGHRGQVATAAFSPDGTRIVTASGDQTACVWVAPSSVPRVPVYWPIFLEMLSRRHLDEDGELTELPESQVQNLTALLTKALEADHSHLGGIARWFLANPEDRPICPGASQRALDVANSLITPDASEGDLLRAYDLSPSHPLIQIALARYEKDEARAAFLRRFGWERIRKLPPDEQAKMRQRAGELMKRR